MSYTVQQLARLANTSVRTLHYYDAIGLLSPSRVSENGYRRYEEPELLKLQQILFFRELDLPLADIKRILQSPYFDLTAALIDQRRLLELKKKRLAKLITTINQTIKKLNHQSNMKDEELYDAFADEDTKAYAAEAKERWGNTDAYKQSQARVSKMTKVQMQELKEDGEKHLQALAKAMDLGVDSPEVQALIKKSHANVNFFYDCSVEMFRNLGKMYVTDPRFTATYEKVRPGLAAFVHQAIELYCDTQTAIQKKS